MKYEANILLHLVFLYQSKDGIAINADVNGSANIGRKCK